ncbi:hypothetical protein [Krasilnikovia sp. M28-CT-15]|uniref:hypothetical protein n=1 Tax=Krasilnikovia sp. M28-CT-15 TaxID=3373540 RepID=UPI00399C7887
MALLLLLPFSAAGCTSETAKPTAAPAGFCGEAEPLKLGEGENLTVQQRLEILRKLDKPAPDSVKKDLATLIHWFDHRDGDEKEASEASQRVGRFIESACGLNLGGIH